MKKKFFLFLATVVFAISLTGCAKLSLSTEKELLQFGERCRQFGRTESIVRIAIDSGDVSVENCSLYFSALEEYEENPTMDNLDELSVVVGDIFDDLPDSISETKTDLE